VENVLAYYTEQINCRDKKFYSIWPWSRKKSSCEIIAHSFVDYFISFFSFIDIVNGQPNLSVSGERFVAVLIIYFSKGEFEARTRCLAEWKGPKLNRISYKFGGDKL
jgi:hypothetical protein